MNLIRHTNSTEEKFGYSHKYVKDIEIIGERIYQGVKRTFLYTQVIVYRGKDRVADLRFNKDNELIEGQWKDFAGYTTVIRSNTDIHRNCKIKFTKSSDGTAFWPMDSDIIAITDLDKAEMAMEYKPMIVVYQRRGNVDQAVVGEAVLYLGLMNLFGRSTIVKKSEEFDSYRNWHSFYVKLFDKYTEKKLTVKEYIRRLRKYNEKTELKEKDKFLPHAIHPNVVNMIKKSEGWMEDAEGRRSLVYTNTETTYKKRYFITVDDITTYVCDKNSFEGNVQPSPLFFKTGKKEDVMNGCIEISNIMDEEYEISLQGLDRI